MVHLDDGNIQFNPGETAPTLLTRETLRKPENSPPGAELVDGCGSRANVALLERLQRSRKGTVQCFPIHVRQIVPLVIEDEIKHRSVRKRVGSSKTRRPFSTRARNRFMSQI
jgi:hypothetical protein